MRKHLLTVMIGLCCVGQAAYAQEEVRGMTFDNLLEEAKADIIFQKQSKDRIKLLDINSDGIISYNEISNAATGVAEIPESMADDAQKEEMKGYFLDAFEDCDKDLNNELSGAEIDEFVDKMRHFFLKQRFDSMDKNHDGVVDVNDMPSQEEAKQQMEEAMQRMQESLDKLDKMDTKEVAERWVNSIGAAVADEDYYQMDKDRNGCVTREEYVTYQMLSDSDADNNSEDKGIKMSASDYGRWYIEIKKANADCVTKEEYIAYQNMPIEQKLDEENTPEKEKMYAELLFDEMDTDSSGKITAEEYAEYNYQRDVNLYAPDEPIMKKEDHHRMFLRIKAPEKGWMSKEEFVEDYIKENIKIKEELENEENATDETTEENIDKEANSEESVEKESVSEEGAKAEEVIATENAE